MRKSHNGVLAIGWQATVAANNNCVINYTILTSRLWINSVAFRLDSVLLEGPGAEGHWSSLMGTKWYVGMSFMGTEIREYWNHLAIIIMMARWFQYSRILRCTNIEAILLTFLWWQDGFNTWATYHNNDRKIVSILLHPKMREYLKPSFYFNDSRMVSVTCAS